MIVAEIGAAHQNSVKDGSAESVQKEAEEPVKTNVKAIVKCGQHLAPDLSEIPLSPLQHVTNHSQLPDWSSSFSQLCQAS